MKTYHSYFTRYAESEFHNPGVLPLKRKFDFRFYKVLFHRFRHKEKLKFQKQLVDKEIFLSWYFETLPSKRAPNSILFISLDVLHIYLSGCQNLSEELLLQRNYRLQNMSSIFLVE